MYLFNSPRSWIGLKTEETKTNHRIAGKHKHSEKLLLHTYQIPTRSAISISLPFILSYLWKFKHSAFSPTSLEIFFYSLIRFCLQEYITIYFTTRFAHSLHYTPLFRRLISTLNSTRLFTPSELSSTDKQH